jgi:predicted ATPase
MTRIVLTGGPGGGKTTAADLFRREIGPRVALVPEAATLLYAGGFPRSEDVAVRRAVQMTIFQLQRNLEETVAVKEPGAILLCDRGTADGAAYWPGEPGEFFASAGTTLERELARYQAVIFFESAAVGGLTPWSGNPYRTEGLSEAAALDARLREVWSRHPHFYLVPHDASFFRKITFGLATLQSLVSQLDHEHRGGVP